jgi:SAM-dependent methyltransferase
MTGLNEELLHRELHQHRPASWDEDISCNSIDSEPFENRPAISERLHELQGLNAPCLRGGDARTWGARDTLPIPVPSDREQYSPHHDGQYWFSGLRDYLNVMDVCQQLGLSVGRLFDFGCASGRVLRHFVAQSDIAELWGSDINARHIRWLYEFMPRRVKPIANHAIPQLPIADQYFDLIIAFSVFTHIDTFETCWLAELKRILKPGGLAYLTVHNDDTWRVLRNELDNENNRLIRSMMASDPHIVEKLQGELPPGKTVFRFTHLGPYRAQVFHSNCYIQNVWGRFFEILEILPCHHVRQSVVVCR